MNDLVPEPLILHLLEEYSKNDFMQTMHLNLPYYFNMQSYKFGECKDEVKFRELMHDYRYTFMTVFLQRVNEGLTFGLQQKFKTSISPEAEMYLNSKFHYRWNKQKGWVNITKLFNLSNITQGSLDRDINALQQECRKFIVTYSSDFLKKINNNSLDLF